MRFSTVAAAALVPVGLALAQNSTNSTGPQTHFVTVGADGQKAYNPTRYAISRNIIEDANRETDISVASKRSRETRSSSNCKLLPVLCPSRSWY